MSQWLNATMFEGNPKLVRICYSNIEPLTLRFSITSTHMGDVDEEADVDFPSIQAHSGVIPALVD